MILAPTLATVAATKKTTRFEVSKRDNLSVNPSGISVATCSALALFLVVDSRVSFMIEFPLQRVSSLETREDESEAQAIEGLCLWL